MVLPKLRPCIALLAFVTLASVSAQTFQYSHGWTNGKRDGRHRHMEEPKEILERILNPCQLKKLRFILEGKPLNEKICDYIDDDNEVQPKRLYTNDRQELLDSFV